VLKPQMIILAVTITFVLSGPSQAAGVAESAHPSVTPPVDTADPIQKAVARARVVPTQMGFDLTKYLSIAFDRKEGADFLNDSTIRVYVAPVALEADWWIVLFLPDSPDVGPPICVYLDKRLDAVRGYIIGPPLSKSAAPGQAKD
jgi:hypothetical protein